MARIASRNTYAFEEIGGERVRRLVVAGQEVPAHFQLENDSDAEESQGGVQFGSVGGSAAELAKAADEETQRSQESQRNHTPAATELAGQSEGGGSTPKRTSTAKKD